MSTETGIIEKLRESFGPLVLPDVEFPTVIPDSLETVVKIVTWCREHQWRILPVGRGHTFSEQHHVPAGVLTVLSTNRRGMSEPSALDLAIEVEAGVPVLTVGDMVARAGLMLDGWPDNYEGTVGGLLAGRRGPQFRHLVLGAVFVDGSARILQLGGAVRKDVSGFDATGVLLGSRGAFAWLDRVILKLKPNSTRPVERISLAPSTQAKDFSGIYRQVAAAFDPDDVFVKSKG